jgi:hypothetical protein
MKKLLLLTLLLLLPICHAAIEYTEIVSKEVANSEDIEAEGETFNVLIIDVSKVKVTFPGGSGTIMSEGDCKEDSGYTVCITDIQSGEEFSGDDFILSKHFNMETGEYNLFADIVIKKPKKDYTFVRTFEKIEFIKGETIRVDVKITNTGSVALPMEFTDEYPPQISITEAFDCTKDSNTIRWAGSLGIGKEKKFYYFIKGISPIEFDSIVILKVNGEPAELSKVITVEGTPIEVTSSIPEALDLGEEANITINIGTTEEGYTVSNFKYKLYLPPGLRVLSQTGDIQEMPGYQLITPDLGEESINYSLKIRPERIGSLQVREEISYVMNNMVNEVSYDNNITISGSPLGMNIPKKSSYAPGEKAELTITILNTNKDITFKNLNLNVETDFGEAAKSKLIEKIEPSETLRALTYPFTAPESGEHKIDVRLTYETIFRDKMTKKETIDIVIKDTTQEYTEEETQDTGVSPETSEPTQDPEKEMRMESVYDTIDQYESETPGIMPIVIGAAIALFVFAVIASAVFITRKKGKSIDDKLKKAEKKISKDIEKGSMLK